MSDGTAPESTGHFDVVVVGAGVRGLCSAALLAHRGKRVLVVAKADRVGGRASTPRGRRLLIGAGAVAIERFGPMEGVFKTRRPQSGTRQHWRLGVRPQLGDPVQPTEFLVGQVERMLAARRGSIAGTTGNRAG